MNPGLSDEQLAETAEIFKAHAGNVSAAAREAGLSRQAVRNRLRHAAEAGMIELADIDRDPNAPTAEEYASARNQKLAAFARKKRKGDWRKPVLISLPQEPFRLKLFGDPHLDADGCNYELFEEHFMDMRPGVYGVCVGDWFNNWTKSLAHLWREDLQPSLAWTLFEHLMAERGEYLIGGCSGNHDDWTNAPADPIDQMMKKHGAAYRVGAIRLMLQAGSYDPIFLAIRHKWKGHSMYSPAHGLKKAAQFGWRDHISAGGHTHVDEPRLHVHDDGFMQHLCQISAFKEYDEFVDVHGFMGHKISPVWDLVIDPRLPDESPDKVKTFWDKDIAQKYLEAIR